MVIVSEAEACWCWFKDSSSLLSVHILMVKLGLRSPQVWHSFHFEDLISGEELFILLLLVSHYCQVCIYANLGRLYYFTILLHGISKSDAKITNGILSGLIKASIYSLLRSLQVF